jgi:hypothetical protein
VREYFVVRGTEGQGEIKFVGDSNLFAICQLYLETRKDAVECELWVIDIVALKDISGICCVLRYAMKCVR